MFALILIFTGCFFNEIKGSISKKILESSHMYSLGVILSFFGLLIFSCVTLFKVFYLDQALSYNFDSTIYSAARVLIEIFLSYLGLQATKNCDRSTYTLIRALTIPFLLLIDIGLGYSIGVNSIIGLSIIFVSFVFFSAYKKTLRLQGWQYALGFAIVAAFTTALYKYNISHYGNSVEIEQLLVFGSFFLFYGYQDYKTTGLESLKIVRDKKFIFQGLSTAFAEVLISYAYLYLNASVVIALKRSGSILWSIIFGKILFKEDKFGSKLLMGICIVIGICFLI